jgi:hypothetical protein
MPLGITEWCKMGITSKHGYMFMANRNTLVHTTPSTKQPAPMIVPSLNTNYTVN